MGARALPRKTKSKPQNHWTNGKLAEQPGPYERGELSQYGKDGKFREVPRWNRPETELSMCQGNLEPEKIYFLISRTTKDAAPEGSQVRIFEASDLRDAGYDVLKTPSANIPIHVSVLAPVGPAATTDEHKNWWEGATKIATMVREVSGAAT